MRKIVHRLLTGFPMLGIALLALLAAADPAQAKVQLDKFVVVMTDDRFFWLCIAIVVGYFLLWWVTSIEPKTRRKKIQDGIRPLFRQMTDLDIRIKKAESDAEFLAVAVELDRIVPPICQWIMDNMGDAAFAKFNFAQQGASMDWTWPSNPGSALAGKRNNVLNFVRARIEVLDIFLQSDGWDGPPTGRWALTKRKFQEWKEKRQSASTPS